MADIRLNIGDEFEAFNKTKKNFFYKELKINATFSYSSASYLQ